MRSFPVLAFMLAGLGPAIGAQPPDPAERPPGPPRDYLGVYVTNFEIGPFIERDTTVGGCDDWVHQEMRWLAASASRPEPSLMQCIARWNGSRDRWALYAISFRGRGTLDRQPKQFLHDTERRVLLDDLLALELIGTDETVEWALPRYRRRPQGGC